MLPYSWTHARTGTGAYIHVALQSGLLQASIKTGPMVLASFLIQVSVASKSVCRCARPSAGLDVKNVAV